MEQTLSLIEAQQPTGARSMIHLTSDANFAALSFAERARARNTEVAASWAAAKALKARAEEEAAFRAPLLNRERCDAQRHGAPFVIKGGFRCSVRVAFFNRRGQFLRVERSDECTWSGDPPSAAIVARPGDAFARVETHRHGNGAYTSLRTLAL